MRTNIEAMYNFLSQKLRDDSDSESAFMRKLHLPMVKLLACFPREDAIPMLIQLAQNNIGEVAATADQIIKDYFVGFNQEDAAIVDRIYRMLFNENIYTGEGSEKHLDDLMMKKIVKDYLMRYTIAFQASQGENITKFIQICLGESRISTMMHDAVDFMKQVIRRCEDVELQVGGKSMTDRVLLHLKHIRDLKKPDEQDVFHEIAQANVFLCVADLAKKNQGAVFGGSFSLMGECSMCLEDLEKRLQAVESVGKPAREDDLCLAYFEALNKFKDIVAVSEGMDADRELLARMISKRLDLELEKLSRMGADPEFARNNEIIYLLFIFLVAIDSKSASVLFYAISLKDHSDIKIRKEATRQIERFDTWISEVDGVNGLQLIESVCKAAEHFYQRNGVPIRSKLDLLKDYVCSGALKHSALFLE